MVLPDALDDWLTDEGDRIVNPMADANRITISNSDRAIYEVWLLDTETRNGGVSQYFANRGLAQWQSLAQIAVTHELPSLREFMAAANAIIIGADDPFDAILDAATDLDDVYDQLQTAIISELRKSTVG